MSGFANPLIGGGGGLVYPSIHSPNYVPGVSGWSINKDGSAEFDDLVIRGTFEGTDWEITSAGLFFYSGTPATGNLVGSWAQSAGGDDGHGNPYPAGLQVTDGNGNGIHLDTDGQLVILGAGLATAGFLQSAGAATSADSPYTLLSGASNNDTVPQVLAVGESQDGSSPAHILLAGFSLSGNDQAGLDIDLVGALRWAAVGSFTNDTYLYRAAAGKLATDGALAVGGLLTASGGIALPAGETVAGPAGVQTITSGFTGSWSGTINYVLLPLGPAGVVLIDWTLVPGTDSDNSVIYSALPAGYRPASEKYLAAITNQLRVSTSPNVEGPGLEITTGGVLECYGVAGAATLFRGSGLYMLGT